jgi:hypothetical protein
MPPKQQRMTCFGARSRTSVRSSHVASGWSGTPDGALTTGSVGSGDINGENWLQRCAAPLRRSGSSIAGDQSSVLDVGFLAKREPKTVWVANNELACPVEGGLKSLTHFNAIFSRLRISTGYSSCFAWPARFS